MKTTKKPITKMDVTRSMAAIETNIKELVKLLGHPDDAVSEEAGRALLQIGELAVEPLAGAILRPSSPIHRIKAIFAVKYVRPRNSLAAQLALMKVQDSERDEKIAELAGRVLFILTFDQIDNEAIEGRRRKWSPDGPSQEERGSLTDRQTQLVNERLTELRAQE
jgi:HEAT repeat protein